MSSALRILASLALVCANLTAADGPKSVPVMQAVPLPNHEVSFQRHGQELTRYYYEPDLRRPFLYPIIGPSGRSLTRMGHPHDPESHSHHNSVWVSHNNVNGVSFWDDRATGRIVHQRVERLEDTDEFASVLVVNSWMTTNKTLLRERRLISVLGARRSSLLRDSWMVIIDAQLEAADETVTLGKTPFGLVGVRMAKTIGVNDGGGTIRNSEGGVNETQVLWKRAKWVDYSGPIAPNKTEGITLMDHPQNPNHPTFFHVRNDGWMGTSLTYDAPRTIEKAKPLRLRYGLHVHAEAPSIRDLEHRWREFTELPLTDINLQSRRGR